jgi:hypothetical protein
MRWISSDRAGLHILAEYLGAVVQPYELSLVFGCILPILPRDGREALNHGRYSFALAGELR